MRNSFLFITSLLLILSLVACSNDEEESSDSNEEENERTLEHASGEVTIPENPDHILAPYLEDSLLALGEKPAAQWSIGEDVIDYLQPQLEDVPTIEWDLPLEETLNQDPDLIIFSSPSSIQNGSYEDYESIAPTYVYEDEVSMDWRKQLTQMGEILNKQDEAQDVLADFDDKVEETKATIDESIGDESVAFLWTMGEEFYIFESTRYGAEVLYNEVGLTQPEFVEELEQEEQWNPISMEKLGELDADHVFVIAEENEPGLEILDESSVWQSIPAVENDQVYTMNDPSHWTIDGVLAHEMTLDAVKDALAE
ncbi:ferrichrome ABC transporter substrate-binding protein [Halobacillus andaensis]|uniref:Ferrichrome ABC transporter substrate-binding protein n=1 Tax=Halobacillus andaensis TaxID=1176239 RepID=A0A917BBK2_HALAA|nr:ABC transporter substrate-binding protein [Halobacillus andaensis]MBP2006335.1 iron complex transport system substrate-binding protein [Halobacillus andaensis]GGF34339.1 ferrichrome ABC transporter substrate-binding protein [Halobacillus andaensis]